MPVQHEDEDEGHSRWKQNDECFEEPPCKMERKKIPESCHAIRILGRRYALTATSHKYLEIGLNVQSRLPMEIILGDNRGNELILHPDTSGKLMENRGAVQRLLEARNPSYFLLRIRNLGMKLFELNGSKIVKLMQSSKCLYLSPATMNKLFTYEYCIDHIYTQLSEQSYLVR
ncbi:uncharacterized protein LOC112589640 [Harpegnathos saltator]|uniref:uncharacterized protein LOC112589122 n=1 Tax=Harpegnathos saltator TaxID=610380 RepID=UPI000DBEEE56|nr:uncharacterized protein LOC112589122 [Harpegnathos saltator]XP_025157071.1 uncharacterized protein LOC112589142 [Harpegnathos saltator]XP_025159479.1 uncharacterized protein LOC112589640 [Harpegnathos saltator]